MNLTAKYFNQTTLAGQPQTDIEPFLLNFPLPAGWSRIGNHPADPYRFSLYSQAQPDGNVFFGYPYQNKHPQCIKLQRMIFLQINPIYPLGYSLMNHECATDISKCCLDGDGSGISGYFTMPRR